MCLHNAASIVLDGAVVDVVHDFDDCRRVRNVDERRIDPNSREFVVVDVALLQPVLLLERSACLSTFA